jgi:hypothetical protein
VTGDQPSASEVVSSLRFPRQAYPNLYLNTERIAQRFRGYLGSIADFRKSAERTVGGDAKVRALFVEAGVQGAGVTGADVGYDLGDPLAQALVLRAYLANSGELRINTRAAPVTDFTLARGDGDLISPQDVLDNSSWKRHGVPAEVVAEIAAEQHRQSVIATSEDPYPLYWVTYVRSESGLAVSLLGAASLFGSDVRSWMGVDMTYCIFGQKIRDWPSWSLVSPLHVWIEPPSAR